MALQLNEGLSLTRVLPFPALDSMRQGAQSLPSQWFDHQLAASAHMATMAVVKQDNEDAMGSLQDDDDEVHRLFVRTDLDDKQAASNSNLDLLARASQHYERLFEWTRTLSAEKSVTMTHASEQDKPAAKRCKALELSSGDTSSANSDASESPALAADAVNQACFTLFQQALPNTTMAVENTNPAPQPSARFECMANSDPNRLPIPILVDPRGLPLTASSACFVDMEVGAPRLSTITPPSHPVAANLPRGTRSKRSQAESKPTTKPSANLSAKSRAKARATQQDEPDEAVPADCLLSEEEMTNCAVHLAENVHARDEDAKGKSLKSIRIRKVAERFGFRLNHRGDLINATENRIAFKILERCVQNCCCQQVLC